MELIRRPDNTPRYDLPGTAAARASAPAAPVPRSLAELVWKGKWFVAVCTVLGVAGAAGYLKHATPLYRAVSEITVDQSNPSILTDSTNSGHSESYLYTQTQLIESGPILALVLEKPEIKDLPTFKHVEDKLEYLRYNVSADVGKKADIIYVSALSPYPEDAARITNALVDAYIKHESYQKRSSAAEVLAILQAEKEKRDRELIEKQAALVKFKQDNAALSFSDTDGNIILKRMAQLSVVLTQAQIDAINARTAYEAALQKMDDPAFVKSQIRSMQGTVDVNETHAAYDLRSEAIKQQMAIYDMKETQHMAPASPTLMAAQGRLKQLQDLANKEDQQNVNLLRSLLKDRLDATETKEADLKKTFDAAQADALALNTKGAQYEAMLADAKRTEKVCDALDLRIKELDVTLGTGAMNISVLESANAPEQPTTHKYRIMGGGLAGGLLIGTILAIVSSLLDPKLRGAAEVEDLLGVTVLETIPHIKGRLGKPLVRSQMVKLEPTSPVAEAFRTVRTAVHFSLPRGRSSTILISSPLPGEGKTTFASNLAISLAQAGRKVLLIDADFRKPMQHRNFNLPATSGFSSYLAGEETLDAAIHKQVVKGLDVLPCGPTPDNPSEIIHSDAFQDALKDLAVKYDYLLLDSPPVVPVTDARILSTMCDATLLVVRADKSRKKPSAYACESLLGVGANILGVVLNDAPKRATRAGAYYGYYGRKQTGRVIAPAETKQLLRAGTDGGAN